MQSISKYISLFKEKKILILGDLVADVYLEGKISRISREAPVLVLDYLEENVVPGGAANVVYNVASLGALAHTAGVVGFDFAGKKLVEALKSRGARVTGCIIDEERTTITKTRIMAGGQATVRQQIVRVDKEKREPLSVAVEQQVMSYLENHLSSMDAVIISDYGSNTITPHIKEIVIQGCKEQQIPCIVDSRYNIMQYKGVAVVKQNEAEAAAAVGYSLHTEALLRQAGGFILDSLEARAVLITRGSEGMTLFEKSGAVTHIPVTNRSEVYDVTGAGDTVVAVFILALSAGASAEEAARLANVAAGIVVRKLGTATTNPQELEQAVLKLA